MSATTKTDRDEPDPIVAAKQRAEQRAAAYTGRPEARDDNNLARFAWLAEMTKRSPRQLSDEQIVAHYDRLWCVERLDVN